MDADTFESLKSMGCEALCQNCMSEDFDHYVAWKGQVLWCEHCCTWMKGLPKNSSLNSLLDAPTLKINELGLQP